MSQHVYKSAISDLLFSSVGLVNLIEALKYYVFGHFMIQIYDTDRLNNKALPQHKLDVAIKVYIIPLR